MLDRTMGNAAIAFFLAFRSLQHGQRKIYMDSARYTIPKYKAKAEANASNLKACISVANFVKVRLSAAQKEES